MLAGSAATGESTRADVIISEIMTQSGEFTNGENDDWLELFNNGSQDINLSGWGLSDKKSEPFLWTFPEGTKLEKGQRLLVYCVGDDAANRINNQQKKTYYASFKLSSGGDSVTLTDKSGVRRDLMKYPAQHASFSYGISADTGAAGFFNEATKRAKNGKTVFANQAERPVFETAPGFYDEPVSVRLTSDLPIYYTLDGSEPSPSNASTMRYTGPIPVEKTTMIRARTIPEDQLMSYVSGGTYFIERQSCVAVVSMGTDAKYLTDPATGLFVRGNGQTANYYREWEYPIYFEFYDENGARQIGQNGSFRIVGTSTRGLKLKSVAVYARDLYGDEKLFDYNPFPNRGYETYRAFIVRNTGSDYKYARCREAVLTTLADNIDIMHQASRQIEVYYNGQYSGQYNLREKINKYSVAQYEGITEKEIIDKIDLLEGEARDNQIQNGSNADWLALRAFIREHDLTEPDNLKYVLDRLDVDSLFTWTSFELAILNADLENVRMYRVPGGKWKYVLYDVEGGPVIAPEGAYMLLNAAKITKGALSSQYSVINKLLKAPEMRIKFFEKYAEVVEKCFLYDSVSNPVLTQWEATLEKIMPRHIEANGGSLTMAGWRSEMRVFHNLLRRAPRASLKCLYNCLNVTKEEQETYFARLERLLNENNIEK